MTGGGSFRVSLVSVETALCVGPRKAVQSWVTASFDSGRAFERTRVCAPAKPAAMAFGDHGLEHRAPRDQWHVTAHPIPAPRLAYDDVNFTPPYLGTITADTLIVFGDRDPFYPVSLGLELRAAIPRSYLWVVPNGGHGPVFGDAAPDSPRRR